MVNEKIRRHPSEEECRRAILNDGERTAERSTPSLLAILPQEVGQFSDTIGDAFELGVGVAHGHAQIGVAHGLLDDRNRYALLCKDRRVGVPQSVNVNNWASPSDRRTIFVRMSHLLTFLSQVSR